MTQTATRCVFWFGSVRSGFWFQCWKMIWVRFDFFFKIGRLSRFGLVRSKFPSWKMIYHSKLVTPPFKPVKSLPSHLMASSLPLYCTSWNKLLCSQFLSLCYDNVCLCLVLARPSRHESQNKIDWTNIVTKTRSYGAQSTPSTLEHGLRRTVKGSDVPYRRSPDNSWSLIMISTSSRAAPSPHHRGERMNSSSFSMIQMTLFISNMRGTNPE